MNNNNKNKLKDLLCSIGLHRWKVVAYGKKSGRGIKIRKCRHCSLNAPIR